MKRIKSYCLCASLVLVSTFFFAYTYPQDRGSIRGHVIDELGEIVIGARIHIKDVPLTAETDVEGYFEIKDLPTGIYDIQVMHDLYYERTSYRVEVKPGVPHDIRVTLHTGKTIFEREQPFPSRSGDI